MRLTWKSYGAGRETGVRAYARLPGAIALRFRTGEVYLYDEASAGAAHIRRMAELAEGGSGLSTYVNRYVHDRYAGKLNLSRD